MIKDDAPWNEADPTRKVGINLPMPAPLMAQLDYLIEKKAIRSKSSFIREVVAQAAEDEIVRVRKVEKALRQMESDERVAGKPDSRAGSRVLRPAPKRRRSGARSGAS